MATQTEVSESGEEEEAFAAVLSKLDKEQLPILAAAIFQRTQPTHDRASSKIPSVDEPVYGSYHILFPITFDTGTRWLAKIPVNGTEDKWDDLSAGPLVSEAETMRLLKRETTIPIPEVLDFSATTRNPLRCPYIIMSLIVGLPLYDVWFGHRLGTSDSDTNQVHRIRVLEGIASAMSQLARFSFRTGGRVLFGSDGSPSGIGSERRVDNHAIWSRLFSDNDLADDSVDDPADGLVDDSVGDPADGLADDPADGPAYVECPAYSNPKDFYTFFLDLYPQTKPHLKGVSLVLRQLISWIPEPEGIDPFVLTHPDFDIQNFIVSEDGELLGIIDWDGVAAAPRSLGNERYPGWLTRDWDPLMYGYLESMEDGVEPPGLWEDSPATLAYYRRVYDSAMVKHRASADINLCRLSLVTDNLAIAANDLGCRDGILVKMLEEMWAVAGQGEDPELSDLGSMFLEDRVDAGLVETLKRGFDVLISKEGL